MPACDRPALLDALAGPGGRLPECPHLAETRTQTVFGTGSPETRLMFIGEAPGADEDRLGEPFVGRAGQLLTDMITKGMGLSRDQVYIANILKCRPPENRTPPSKRRTTASATWNNRSPSSGPSFSACSAGSPSRRCSNHDSSMGKAARQVASVSRYPHDRHVPPVLSATEAGVQEGGVGRPSDAHERDGFDSSRPYRSN